MKFQHWQICGELLQNLKLRLKSRIDNSDKAGLAEEDPFALNPHPRSVPSITQTPPFLNYFRGKIERSVAQIEEIQGPRAP